MFLHLILVHNQNTRSDYELVLFYHNSQANLL